METASRKADRIRVDASDNVMVTKVLITVLDEEGRTLEQGEATLIEDARWEYAPVRTTGKVIVQAFDLAGNVTRQEA